jgi:hypothetical protein
MLLFLLIVIQNFINDTKYIIETTPSIKFIAKFFDCVAYAFGPYIAA